MKYKDNYQLKQYKNIKLVQILKKYIYAKENNLLTPF